MYESINYPVKMAIPETMRKTVLRWILMPLQALAEFFLQFRENSRIFWVLKTEKLQNFLTSFVKNSIYHPNWFLWKSMGIYVSPDKFVLVLDVNFIS